MKRLLSLVIFCAAASHAETGAAGWLRYARITDASVITQSGSLPAVVVALSPSPVVQNAQRELIRGMRAMLARTLREETAIPAENAFVLGTIAEI